MRAFRFLPVAIASLVLAVGGCSSDDEAASVVLLDLPDASAGDVVGLIAVEVDGRRSVEWVDRLDGTVRGLDIDADADPETAEPKLLATIDVSTSGEQQGLLGQVMIDGRRFVSFVSPDAAGELLVAEVVDGAVSREVWSAGAAASGAIGGVLDEDDGRIVIGLGRNTGWDAESKVGGAILTLDPDGDRNQVPTEISVGYTNPWAYTVTRDGAIWVADNAAGPDPDEPDRDDIERIGRADLVPDRNDMAEILSPGRAPAAMLELPDGRIGICGFLDDELRAYEIVDTDTGPATGLERAGTIMPCITGAAIFSDGTIVTAAQTDTGESLQILRP